MKTKHLSSITAPAVALFMAVGIAGHAGVTTETISFSSNALGAERTYVAALPSPLKPDHLYPVLYLLHGATGNSHDWTYYTTFTEMLDGRDMIVIMPDGDEFGWYLDSKLKPGSRYDSAVSQDVRKDVEARYPVIKDRRGRAIAGLSMGGHGALSLAAKHPDLYVSVSSMSGILDVTAHPGKWQLDDILGKLPDALAEWKRHSVVYLADRFTTADVALLFDTGTEDETGAVADNRHLHQELSRLGVPHVYNEYKGTHNWDYWGARIEEHLDFHWEQFDKARN